MRSLRTEGALVALLLLSGCYASHRLDEVEPGCGPGDTCAITVRLSPEGSPRGWARHPGVGAPVDDDAARALVEERLGLEGMNAEPLDSVVGEAFELAFRSPSEVGGVGVVHRDTGRVAYAARLGWMTPWTTVEPSSWLDPEVFALHDEPARVLAVHDFLESLYGPTDEAVIDAVARGGPVVAMAEAHGDLVMVLLPLAPGADRERAEVIAVVAPR